MRRGGCFTKRVNVLESGDVYEKRECFGKRLWFTKSVNVTKAVMFTKRVNVAKAVMFTKCVNVLESGDVYEMRECSKIKIPFHT